MTSRDFDAVVIGAGQAGGPLATALAGSGRRTALIEREHVGGTCVNEGCTPTKTMVASARVAYLARRASDYGVETGDVRVDLAKVRDRKRDLVEQFREGSEQSILNTKGLDLLRGEARFTAPKSLAIKLENSDELAIRADLIVINAGGRPAMLPVDGIDQIDALNSTTIMELADVPSHLIVVGGGYIGLEFAQMFRRFGSDVTVVQRGSQLLTGEDDDVAAAVADILREDGIDILLDTTIASVEPVNGGVRARLRGGDEQRSISGSHFLAAAGRTPNSDLLDLDAAGIDSDKRGYIPVDAQLATNIPSVYALGDINGGPAFTHVSYDDFRILRTNLIEGGSASTTGRLVPYTAFIDPQLGRVGLSERQARKADRAIRVATMPMSSVARALETDEPRGLMKVVVDAKTDQILGCAILGIEGGEIMSMVQLAMRGKLPASALRDGIFAHPTLAEGLNGLFGAFDDA